MTRARQRPGEPTLEEIRRAKRIIADVIRLHGDAYAPLLERVLKEEDAAQRRKALVERAIRISTGADA